MAVHFCSPHVQTTSRYKRRAVRCGVRMATTRAYWVETMVMNESSFSQSKIAGKSEKAGYPDLGSGDGFGDEEGSCGCKSPNYNGLDGRPAGA